jgi:Tfp pilus assembly protein PilP
MEMTKTLVFVLSNGTELVQELPEKAQDKSIEEIFEITTQALETHRVRVGKFIGINDSLVNIDQIAEIYVSEE